MKAMYNLIFIAGRVSVLVVRMTVVNLLDIVIILLICLIYFKRKYHRGFWYLLLKIMK